MTKPPKLSAHETFSVNPSADVSFVTNGTPVIIFPEAFALIATLSTPAVKVLSYILLNLDPDTMEVKIDMEKCCKDLNYVFNVGIYKGLANLVDAEFIFRKVGQSCTYFINVTYINVT